MKNRGFNLYFVLILGLLLLVVWTSMLDVRQSEYTKGELIESLEADEVVSASIQPNRETPTGEVEVVLSDGQRRTLYVTDVTEMEELLSSYNIDPKVEKVREENWFLNSVFPVLLAVIVMVFFFVMINNQSAGGNSKMMNFGKSRAKLSTGDGKVTLKDVAGLKEEKEDLEEIVEFLKEPAKFTKVGARIPKGVLLEGAPGTGKTLLAKAIAGEAGVPFFSISGSDFVEMFVGVGASRVRDLFEEAKRHAPCIVFIDEIDAVARRRGTGMGGGHDEREQTLNQLLVEMDGFGVNEGIIVLAATNRVDILDPAILRPGRFDRKISVNRPDVGGREEILQVHAKNKPLADDVDLKQIAQTTAGFTGADLENLLNEASIIAAKDDRAFVKQEDIKKAFIKVGIGAEKKSRIISDKEKKITAYHEAGHAILFHVLPDVGPVYTVSIIPTGLGAAGYTMPLPEKDEMFITKGKMLQDIMVSLGGRIAEEIIFNDITTGASSDIKKATSAARDMVTKYGMSENIGVINYNSDDDEVFIGRDLAHAKNHSEFISGEIDKEVKSIIDECYRKAKEIILEHTDVLHKCADLLLEKEKIGRDEFEALFEVKNNSPEGFFES
ncbi:MAG: ATP-dependent zinc metalloprotease FtsH [Lachnospiraceae bacterium]|nr:ATP-dependent zinc metalloprotease FtsH [Lachnospiraceae bacterium]MCI7189891.1 ATP-dependent zinc metalloprotease FtsH [Lachnospiraceae bacterium]MDD7629172.1 ATP-dependent zinc metalloprotease FtsH [Lachnospiraceae bacterium]MDY4118730.1 ATP-dependent zinc metalloprotease FtsH [Lachnospiraceae bacterium]